MKTALFDLHSALKAKMVDYNGWELPVRYSSVTKEHEACRKAAAIFDVSHMGEFRVKGTDALAFLNHLCTNDLNNIKDGQAQYTVMCNEKGGVVDDLIIYRMSPQELLMVVNAANIQKDWDHAQTILKTFGGQATLTNESDQTSQIALQGPKAVDIIQSQCSDDLKGLSSFHFIKSQIAGVPALISRSGYTGEDGFEIYCEWAEAPKVWEALTKGGEATPCGLAARDTLRLEACLCLYGQELNEQTHPWEAGLGWVVKMNKGDFVGRTRLESLKQQGYHRKLVGIEMVGRGIPRTGYAIASVDNRTMLGQVTSGTQSPTLGKAIALAYVDSDSASLNTDVNVIVRGQPIPAKIVKKPFYKRGA